MKAYVFPGQGAQFPGMGKELYENFSLAKEMFNLADEILGFRITQLMFNGSEEDLRQTGVTQPSIFLHSVILSKVIGDKFNPQMVAGHSLGEFSSLVASGALSFEDGLRLVHARAQAMQKACEAQPSTMAAVIGLEDHIVENVCTQLEEVVVPANYNAPGQIVISGSMEGIEAATEKFRELGAKKVMKLRVGGAFHSPLMEPAKIELGKAIKNTTFSSPVCPVYQNVSAKPVTDPEKIKENLVAQLTSPVKWTQTVENMLHHGASSFIEVGPGNVLQGLIKKVDRKVPTESASAG